MRATVAIAETMPSRDLFGQPRGLIYLAATELWDRISFHGMQALLVLYMVGELLLPGHVERIAGFAAFRAAIEGVTGPLTVTALAAQVFGLYVGLVYFTPIVGGAIGDRIGRRRTITAGALLMTAGHFAMAFDASFLVALACLILGAGAMRGNLEAQVGALYGPDDRRRDDGFQLFYIGINVGAFIAPIACGALGAVYGWHVAFGAAGIGMLIGLAIYLAGHRHLPPETVRATVVRAPLTTPERRTIAVLVALIPVLALFWIAQSQVWNVYNLWVRDHVDLTILGWTMPVPWLQALDGIAPVVLMAPTLAWWRNAGAARDRARRHRQDRHRLPDLCRRDRVARRRAAGDRAGRAGAAAVGGRLPPAVERGLAVLRADRAGAVHPRRPRPGQRDDDRRDDAGDLRRLGRQRAIGRAVRDARSGALLAAPCGDRRCGRGDLPRRRAVAAPRASAGSCRPRRGAA